jgi:hypothetical protein
MAEPKPALLEAEVPLRLVRNDPYGWMSRERTRSRAIEGSYRRGRQSLSCMINDIRMMICQVGMSRLAIEGVSRGNVDLAPSLVRHSAALPPRDRRS